MDKLQVVTDSVMKRLSESAANGGSGKPLPSSSKAPECMKCADSGWLQGAELEVTRMGHVQNVLVRCSCKTDFDKQKRNQYLLAMDGLTTDERTKRFLLLDDGNYAPGILHAIRQAVQDHRGLITLFGGFGVGKTTLLMCAVNEGRDAGKLAMYTTLTDLLDYLRSTFGPDADDNFDKYWDALIHCDILALDELDEPHTTPWAMERFLRLIDERWRRMDEALTLCATNNRIQSLPGKIQSRLRDGRAQIISIEGHDMRPANSWD